MKGNDVLKIKFYGQVLRNVILEVMMAYAKKKKKRFHFQQKFWFTFNDVAVLHW